MMQRPGTILLQGLTILTVLVSIPGRALELGDPAPALHIARWAQGSPIDLEKSRGHDIVVVEFWATWCGPCRVSIPHLNELQSKYAKDHVRIVGVTDEAMSVVKPFLKRMEATMQYTVALDDEEKTFANYMKAFGVDGIPHAFVIDRAGRLVWHGHPMDGLDKAVAEILAGTFDLAAARQASRAARLIPLYLEAITADQAGPDTKEIGQEILAHHQDDEEFLNDLAWYILTDASVQHRDLALAEAAARRAHEKTQGRSSSINDTYARALFERGQVREAVAMQEKAIAANHDQEEEPRLRAALEKYRQKLKTP